MLAEYGYEYTVYVDPDAWPLDDALKHEVPLVRGVGCIATFSPDCMELGPYPKNRVDHLQRGGVPGRSMAQILKMYRERADEYRLVSDPDNLNLVKAAAAAAGRSYETANGTPSAASTKTRTELSRVCKVYTLKSGRFHSRDPRERNSKSSSRGLEVLKESGDWSPVTE